MRAVISLAGICVWWSGPSWLISSICCEKRIFSFIHHQVKTAAFRGNFLLVGRKEQSRGLIFKLSIQLTNTCEILFCSADNCQSRLSFISILIDIYCNHSKSIIHFLFPFCRQSQSLLQGVNSFVITADINSPEEEITFTAQHPVRIVLEHLKPSDAYPTCAYLNISVQ